MTAPKKKTDNAKNESNSGAKSICGIVMPISGIDGCSEKHWADVLRIVSDGIEDAGFVPNLVSASDDIGVIQKRIVQNLYENPVVVCDVSAKNPNVMFELGLRLAFDKPTIIIKDDKTDYSFDTSPIEHLTYRRDLRFGDVVEFKAQLASKIEATYAKSTSDKDYTSFLGHFGKFKVAKLESEEISGDRFIIEQLSEIRSEISAMRKLSRGGSSIDRDREQRLEFNRLARLELRRFCSERELNAEELNQHFGEFCTRMESVVSPADYFDSPIEFHDALRRTVAIHKDLERRRRHD